MVLKIGGILLRYSGCCDATDPRYKIYNIEYIVFSFVIVNDEMV